MIENSFDGCERPAPMPLVPIAVYSDSIDSMYVVQNGIKGDAPDVWDYVLPKTLFAGVHRKRLVFLISPIEGSYLARLCVRVSSKGNIENSRCSAFVGLLGMIDCFLMLVESFVFLFKGVISEERRCGPDPWL